MIPGRDGPFSMSIQPGVAWLSNADQDVPPSAVPYSSASIDNLQSQRLDLRRTGCFHQSVLGSGTGFHRWCALQGSRPTDLHWHMLQRIAAYRYESASCQDRPAKRRGRHQPTVHMDSARRARKFNLAILSPSSDTAHHHVRPSFHAIYTSASFI